MLSPLTGSLGSVKCETLQDMFDSEDLISFPLYPGGDIFTHFQAALTHCAFITLVTFSLLLNC